MPKELIPVAGSIIAALIAGIVTFIITVLSKEQKTSEFRQVWIDALRNDISDLMGHMGVIISVIRTKISDGESVDEIIKYVLNKEDTFIRVETLINRVRLRINPDEHTKFIESLNEFSGITRRPEKLTDKKAIEDATKKLLQESQALLKKEWRRVKRGEFIFRITKWSALGVFLTSVASTAIYLSGHILVQYIP